MKQRSTNSAIFIDFVIQHSLLQFVNGPTRGNNILDLVFSNDAYSINNLEILPPFSSGDHYAITFKLYRGPAVDSSDALKKYNFKHANWNDILESVSVIDWSDLFHNKHVQELWDIFHFELIKVIDNHVPMYRANVNRSRTKHYPKHIGRLQTRKFLLWKKWRSTKNEFVKARYLEISKQCRKAIYDYVLEKETSFIDSNNTGKFYNYVNKKMASKTGIGVLKSNVGDDICEPALQAALLNEYFASTFVNDNGILPNFQPRVDANTFLSYVPFDQGSILKKLNKLRAGTTSEPDNIPAQFLKHVSPYICQPLSFLFESFFLNSYIPPVWKIAHVRPIHKSGSASDVANYRPICLTCICGKVMESIISDHLLEFLLEHKLISKNQHGFLSKRSTCTQLIESLQDWVMALKSKIPLDIAYIDFRKAFETVSHPKLLHKLSSYGIKFELLAWIREFLENRSQCVMVDGHCSNFIAVKSGVVQGSVIGPLLFILYINDIMDLIDAPSVCKLYADDLKLYSEVKTCTNSITSSLLRIEDWSRVWQLKINCSKCAVIHLGNSNPLVQYSIDKVNLPNVKSIRDLGVVYSDKLDFNEHISNIVIIAYQRVNLIFRGFTFRNTLLLTRTYINFVRPILVYCTPCWSPYLLKDIDKIENVQRYFTRRLFSWSLYTYNERLFLLGLESLESRRLKYDLKLYFQIIHDHIHLDKSNFFRFIPINH